jgi:hypothetical protein
MREASTKSESLPGIWLKYARGSSKSAGERREKRLAAPRRSSSKEVEKAADNVVKNSLSGGDEKGSEGGGGFPCAPVGADQVLATPSNRLPRA